MSDDHTTRLELPYLAAAQAQKHVTLNAALGRLDGLIACNAKSRGVAAPPSTPADGDLYIAPAGASGAWASATVGDLLRWDDGVWFIEPAPVGLIALVEDEARLCLRTAAGWAALGDSLGEAQQLARLGVGTAADGANPFAAKLNAALLTARTTGEGGSGDLRLTLNKATAGATGSILLQDGYGGRAEIGLCGDDDLSLKVSADGASWTTALKLARADGAVSVNGEAAFDGAGVYSARRFTAAALPAAGAPGRVVWCDDAGGGGALLISDGSAWRRMAGGAQAITADADAALGRYDAPVQRVTAALTAARTLTLPATAALGTSFRIVRSGGGAGSLSVGGLKTLADQTWCDVAWDGAAWRLIGGGAL